MRVRKPLVYCNIVALMINGIIIWLMLVKIFPPILGIVIFLGCLLGAVWFSCLVNGKLPNKAPRYPFYSSPTKEMERL